MTNNNKAIISIIGAAATGIAGFFLVKKFTGKNALETISDNLNKVKDPKVFEEQKHKVLSMLEESRKKFNEKNKFPTKDNRKAEIHQQNHNVKSFTKPSF